MSPLQQLQQVEIPLALPIILAASRVSGEELSDSLFAFASSEDLERWLKQHS